MADIVFIPLYSAGHLFPTFKLAKLLKARGHRVRYFAGGVNGQSVLSQGFECLTVLEELMKRAWSVDATEASEFFVEANKFLLRNRRDVVRLFRNHRIDLLLVDRFLPAIPLIAHSAGIPSVFLQSTPDLQMPNYVISRILADENTAGMGIAASTSFLRLALFPKEFDFPNNVELRQGWYYVECMDLDRVEREFCWDGIGCDKPLVYCAMGSIANEAAIDIKSFFNRALSAMALKSDWQMIMATGSSVRHQDLVFIPSNAMVVEWAPQLTLLRRADLMITHGGTGTIKECIISGVPMIVFPLAGDGPAMAARVVYHKLGVRGDARGVTAEQIASMIGQIETDPSFKSRVMAMGRRFLEFERSQRGVRIIEKILATVGRQARPAILPDAMPDVAGSSQSGPNRPVLNIPEIG